ncbi:hypothetical protein [Arthrobacter sp. QXT-31]|uniref:hypothetical protein n=1 Tax=Arthrobacter sp. QXT-31 TaxID=1357915 RepID=UPI0012F8A4D2|nr:hypothetical protein [Arthrobacter sp. QXT-31]
MSMEELLFRGTLLTARLGGVVALLAPCCPSTASPSPPGSSPTDNFPPEPSAATDTPFPHP